MSDKFYGHDVTPKVGSLVWLGENPVGELLTPGSKFKDSGFPGCDFYLPTGSAGPVKKVAVNVKVTGKTLQKKHGDYCVKVKIEFVGDCEPSTFAPGWMKVF